MSDLSLDAFSRLIVEGKGLTFDGPVGSWGVVFAGLLPIWGRGLVRGWGSGMRTKGCAFAE